MNDSDTASSTSEAAADPGFHVPTWMHLLSGWIHRNPRLWIRLGNVETRAVADVTADHRVDRPIFVAGLARSGTTVLLEQLAAHPQVASHRYIDYPPVLTPYWWNRWLDMVPRATEIARERAHQDGISITSQSPEAFEEVLWMAFFPEAHDPARSSVMGRQHTHREFERFYDEHLRKLLAVRKRQRYVAKGNYNLVRLGYLHRLYPDARFVLAIRDPVWHIASLIKQHRLFLAGESAEPRALEHMRRVGHYEFGLDRRPINIGEVEPWRPRPDGARPAGSHNSGSRAAKWKAGRTIGRRSTAMSQRYWTPMPRCGKPAWWCAMKPCAASPRRLLPRSSSTVRCP